MFVVEVPMTVPSRLKRQLAGVHSMTAVCHVGYVAAVE
jgi:hypothetical protein